MNKKTLLIPLLILILLGLGMFLTKHNIIFAGTLNNASSPAATLYTLTDIYNRLTTNSTATEEDHDLGPSASPASSGYTLTQIYDAIPTIDASKVVYGTSYLGISGTATTVVSTLCFDTTNYHNAISSCSESNACDSSFNGTYTADGIVVNEGTCETGDVCFDDPNYYSNISSCDNNDPCDSDIASSYSADGLVCNGSCVVDGSVADDGACCHNDNCDSGDCTDNVCVDAYVTGLAGYNTPSTAYANPYTNIDAEWSSSVYFTVDAYPSAVAYYLYVKDGTNTLPTSNNPADWTGWTTGETTTYKRTSPGTFGYSIFSLAADPLYKTFFVVAKFSDDTYTTPVGVRVEYWTDAGGGPI